MHPHPSLAAEDVCGSIGNTAVAVEYAVCAYRNLETGDVSGWKVARFARGLCTFLSHCLD